MKTILRIIVLFLFSSSVYAEFLGLTPGRTARVQAHAKTSIELGASWYSNQLEWTALRLNIKPSMGLTLFVDYAKLRVTNLPINASQHADFSGYGVGGGAVFGIPDFLSSYDIAFKGTYHASNITNKPINDTQSPVNLTLHQQQWNADLIISPIDPVFENGLTWYSTLGYVSTSAHAGVDNRALAEAGPIIYRSINGLSLGAGIVKPLQIGSAYVGFEWLSSDPLVAVGFRYAF